MSQFEDYLAEIHDLHFDDKKIQLIQSTIDEIDFSKLDFLIEELRFDKFRVSLLESLLDSIELLPEETFLRTISKFDFDDYKVQAIKILQPKVHSISFSTYEGLARKLKFEKKRLNLIKSWNLKLSNDEMIRFLVLADSDEGVLSYYEYFASNPEFSVSAELLGKLFYYDENYFKLTNDEEFKPTNSKLSFVIFGKGMTGNALPINRTLQMLDEPWKVTIERSMTEVKVICQNLENKSRIEQSYPDRGRIEVIPGQIIHSE